MRGGFVAFNDGNFSGHNTAVLWVREDAISTSGRSAQIVPVPRDREREREGEDNDRRRGEGLEEKPADMVVFEDVVQVMQQSTDNMNMGAWKVAASMKRSTITVNGPKSYGVYFEKNEIDEEEIEEAVLEGMCQRKSARVVFLESTNISVPDGAAIYGENLDGHVILKNNSRLSGSLLLRAGPTSELSVFAHASSVIGGRALIKMLMLEFFCLITHIGD